MVLNTLVKSLLGVIMVNGTYSTIDSQTEMELLSKVFKHEGIIPIEYTCQGEDKSPALSWSTIDDAKSYTLIVDDPDAPAQFLKPGEDAFVHWVVYNIEQNITGLPENSQSKTLEGSANVGVNDFGKTDYHGPCPPAGPAHRYRFTIYAVNKKLDLPSGASKKQVLKAMDGAIIAQAQIVGTYERH